MTNELTTTEFMPAMTIEEAIARRNAIVDFVKRAMVEKTDFGVIPGTDKPTLLKPGAEKLCTLFHLAPRFVLIESEKDWTGSLHGGEPFFYFHYKCELRHGDQLIAEGDGSCNSWEKKYRWRQADRICPNCGKPAIKRSRFPPRDMPEEQPGWYCHAKVGGCGSEFAATAESIVSQPTGQVANADVADVVNTLQKMSQKRALIAATLIAVNASEFFTQDIEDMAIEGVYTQVATEKPKSEQVGNHAKTARQSWAASSALITKITAQIPYYGGARPHIINALKELGEAGTIKLEMPDEEVFAIVNAHASQRADEEQAKKAAKK